ncbi:MAG: MotA/TolQ/ExbB proton channel family protein [Myxococcota bacterium]|nr:MotA/TolQ/ExbB proton channel family protein [Myxococcota bacterium]
MDLEQKMLDFALLGAGWVMWLLVALSVLCVGVAIERLIFSLRNSTPAAELQQALNAYLSKGDKLGFKQALDSLKGVEARVLAAGIEAAEDNPSAAEEAIAGTMIFEKAKMGRGLIVLGSTGSNAPFVGLLGTVLGIIKAFADLATATDEASTAVMAGISEALVATAIGLLVAIPAVVAFNFFQQRNKNTLSRVESLSHLVLARVKADHGGALAQKGA